MTLRLFNSHENLEIPLCYRDGSGGLKEALFSIGNEWNGLRLFNQNETRRLKNRYKIHFDSKIGIFNLTV